MIDRQDLCVHYAHQLAVGMFERFAYLSSLVIVLACLGLIDRRWQLVFYTNLAAAWRTLLLGMVFFSAWDLIGIWQHIFFSGHSRFMSGIYIIKNFPIEEILFLAILNYAPLIVWEVLGMRNV
jgi:lycopene cyclase domain-containing protein